MLPPATPESPVTTHVKNISEIHLPPRDIAMRYITVFFEQVHCIYWVYSPEQFYSQLDKTLEDSGTSSSPSWLCSLYSIFAIASVLPTDPPSQPDHLSSSYYLSMAKMLSIQVCEIADVESLRAMVLLVGAARKCPLRKSPHTCSHPHDDPESGVPLECLECLVLSDRRGRRTDCIFFGVTSKHIAEITGLGRDRALPTAVVDHLSTRPGDLGAIGPSLCHRGRSRLHPNLVCVGAGNVELTVLKPPFFLTNYPNPSGFPLATRSGAKYPVGISSGLRVSDQIAEEN